MAKGFDVFGLRTEKADTGVEMVVKHPVDKSDTGARIYVLGIDSEVWRNNQKKISRKAMERLKKGKKAEIDYDEAERDTNRAIAQMIVGWKDLAPDFEYSPENAMKLVQDEKLSWLVDDIVEFMNERENFF